MFTAVLVACLLVIAATVLRTRPWRLDRLVTRYPAELPSYLPARAWTPQPGGVLIGASDPHPSAEWHDGLPFLAWRFNRAPHLLLAGPSGTGKTESVRFIAASLLQSGVEVGFIDGKRSGVAAPFAGRSGVWGVADSPDEWLVMVRLVRDEIRSRFQRLYDARYSDTQEPTFRPLALVIDEMIDATDACGEEFTGPLFEVARMGREAGGVIFASILRPDTTTLPGQVRESLSGRILLGKPKRQSAQMLFEDDARRAREVGSTLSGEKGCGVAMLGGAVRRIQIPHAADLKELLPPLRGLENRTAFERAMADKRTAASRIAELRGQGVEYKRVAQLLNADGHRQRDGKLWTQAAVRLEDGKHG